MNRLVYTLLARRTPQHRWARTADVRCTCTHAPATHGPDADCSWPTCHCQAYTPPARWWLRAGS